MCCPTSSSLRFRGLRTLSDKIERNVHDFFRTRFLLVGQKTPIRTSDEKIGRVVRRVVQRVREARPRSSDNTSDEEIGITVINRIVINSLQVV